MNDYLGEMKHNKEIKGENEKEGNNNNNNNKMSKEQKLPSL